MLRGSSSNKVTPVVAGGAAEAAAEEETRPAAGTDEITAAIEVEASKPADASDVATYEDARNELMRVRALLRSQVEAKSARDTADDPDKAYNENVVSVFRSHVLQRIGPDGRNDDDGGGGGGGKNATSSSRRWSPSTSPRRLRWTTTPRASRPPSASPPPSP